MRQFRKNKKIVESVFFRRMCFCEENRLNNRNSLNESVFGIDMDTQKYFRLQNKIYLRITYFRLDLKPRTIHKTVICTNGHKYLDGGRWSVVKLDFYQFATNKKKEDR